MLLANVLLLNLLIALLSNVYSEVISRVECEYRAVVVMHYEKWNWNAEYGLLIFLPSPLSYIALLLCPLYIFIKDTTKLNDILCRICYVIYAIPQFIMYILTSLLLILPVYAKGFLFFGRHGFEGVRNPVADFMIDDLGYSASSVGSPVTGTPMFKL